MELPVDDVRLWLRRVRRSRLLRPALAAAIVVITGVITADALSGASEVQRAYGERRSMAIAEQDLEIGHVIEAEDLVERELPVAVVPSDPVADPIGRVVLEPIVAGEVVVSRRVSESAGSGPAALVPSSRRAIAIERSPLMPPVRPGDRVELLAVGSGARASIIARRGLVIEAGNESVTVTITEAELPAVARAILEGTVILALIGER